VAHLLLSTIASTAERKRVRIVPGMWRDDDQYAADGFPLVHVSGRATVIPAMVGMLLMYAYNYQFYLQYFKAAYSNKYYPAFLVMWPQIIMVLIIGLIMISIASGMTAMGITELQPLSKGI
jgi:hypothetical protein